MMPPMTPVLVYGSTMRRTTSHVVEPRATRPTPSASVGSPRTHRGASPEAMNGMIITARMTPRGQDADADRRSRDERVATGTGMPPSAPCNGCWTQVASQGPEHHQAPHAIDDRRHGGASSSIARAERALQPARRQLGQEQRDAETRAGTATSSAIAEVARVP